jgi:hypothetical protein
MKYKTVTGSILIGNCHVSSLVLFTHLNHIHEKNLTNCKNQSNRPPDVVLNAKVYGLQCSHESFVIC